MSSIVSDVGGTNARFAFAERMGAALTDIWTAQCADFPTIDAAVEAYRQIVGAEKSAHVDAMAIAVAAPVKAAIVDVTNNHWRFEKSRLLDRLRLDELLVINDFTAQALAQHEAANCDRSQLLDGVENTSAPLLVIGPGTGLGVSALIPVVQGPLPVEGEGGNIRFAPQTEPERDLCAYMKRQTDHVVVEHFVSGPGLENIYRFLVHASGTESSLSAERIATSALREEGICRDAVNMMIGILGAAMGDHVLTMGCWRGAVIAGGIMPHLQPLIVSSPFERRFRSAGEMSHILGNVPVWLSTDPHAGLKGAQAAFGNPHLSHRIVTR